MQPISINVQIQVGVTDQLYKLLAPLANLPAGTRKAQIPAKEDKPEPAAEPAEPQQEQPAPEASAEPAPAEQPAQDKEYTEVDVRAAMDKVRRRIEGENYKEQTDSEGYKKWHRALTGWFKNTAAVCGAEKPSALPDSKSRYMFIQCCENVYVKDDELVEDCPF